MTRIDLLTEASHAEIDHEGIPGVEGGGGGGGSAELAYAEFTGDVSVTATAEATPNDVVSAGSVSFDGSTAVIIEFFATSARPASGGNELYFHLYEDGTSLGRLALCTQSAGTEHRPVLLRRRLTPSAGNHTYKVGCRVNSGTGVVAAGTGGSGSAMAGYIRITTA